MTAPIRGAVTRRILAEVRDRYQLSIPGSGTVSRHHSVTAAQRLCAKLNCVFPAGQPPYVVYARLPAPGRQFSEQFIELASWRVGYTNAGDRRWSYPDHRFGSVGEAEHFANHIKLHRPAITLTAACPCSHPVTHRWDGVEGRAVPIKETPPCALTGAGRLSPAH